MKMELKETFEKSLSASRALNLLDEGFINSVLLQLADKTLEKTDFILEENKKDLDRMDESDPMYDRLMLSRERIEAIAADIKNVASLPTPVGETLGKTVRPNGMVIRKVRVPFGVIGVIYEARPNVSFDVFSLCFKTSNACILKGGHDAWHSNNAIVSVIKEVLKNNGTDENAVTLLPSDRQATAELLNAVGYVDLLIPRGGKGLIEYVRDNSRIPVIETGAGICHTYFDIHGDTEKGKNIIFNAKTRRVSVCNALDCLVIHSERLKDLPALTEKLSEKGVIIYADKRAYHALDGYYPTELLENATQDSYGTEFLDYKMAVKTVDSPDEAIAHITEYSSRHSESIITENAETSLQFQKRIDAACVYVNVSTAFTDGGQFGFGAEIGISTQKLHARGPMALPELTSYKYLITGDGQIR